MNNLFKLETEYLTLGFSKTSGSLVLLSLSGSGENIIKNGDDEPVCEEKFNDVYVHYYGNESAGEDITGNSLSGNTGRTVKEITRQDSGDKIIITVIIEYGPLIIDDVYEIKENLIKQTVTISNTGKTEIKITGLRFILPRLRISSAEDCFFEAPGTAVRPHLSFKEALEIQNSNRPVSSSYPASVDRYGFSMEEVPDCSPGLLAVYNGREQAGILCWYYSETENARPVVKSNCKTLDLIHEVSLAGWLKAGEKLTGGSRFLMPGRGTWNRLLKEFQKHYITTGVFPPVYEKAPEWVEKASIYEVHPGQFGGFRGLKEYLPVLKNMGINTLYLMPVWLYDNPSGEVWDENWKRNGSPYAILDYEKLDPSLGSDDSFRELVEEAHSLGIRVLLDFVAQGCACDSGYVHEHPEWFCRDEEGNFVSSHGWKDTYSFDWANPDYQRYMLNWSLELLKTFGFDGYRVDAPLGKEPNWSRDIPYHASKTNLGVISLLEELQKNIKRIKKDNVLLCELFGPVFTRSHDFSCDYLPSAQTFQMLRNRITPYEWGEWMRDYRLSLPENALRVSFTETHDTRGFNPPSYGLRGSALEKAGFSALILAGFIPMIWSGQEKGQEEFYTNLLNTRSKYDVLTKGMACFNLIDCSNEWVVNVLRIFDNQILWGLISLWPEKTTHTFKLPAAEVKMQKNVGYSLYDLLESKDRVEYGIEVLIEENSDSVKLTPDPFKPYFFLLKGKGNE